MPKRKPNKEFNVDSWFEGPPSPHGRVCQTCTSSEEIREAIRRYLELAELAAKQKRRFRNLSDFHRALQKELRFQPGIEALRRHIRSCLRSSVSKRGAS